MYSAFRSQRRPMKRQGKMGDVYAQTTFHGSKAKKTLRLLVDTGSTYTWIPASIARSLGVAPADRAVFELADGRTIGRTVGELSVEILGRRATRRVVFARKGDSNVIGVDTLQGLLSCGRSVKTQAPAGPARPGGQPTGRSVSSPAPQGLGGAGAWRTYAGAYGFTAVSTDADSPASVTIFDAVGNSISSAATGKPRILSAMLSCAGPVAASSPSTVPILRATPSQTWRRALLLGEAIRPTPSTSRPTTPTLCSRAPSRPAPRSCGVEDSPVGTRGFIVRDPEGLYWSFGTPLPKLVRDTQGQWRPDLEAWARTRRTQSPGASAK